MKKRLNQAGFSPIMVLLLIVIVAIVGFAGWNVYQSQHKTNNTLSDIAQSQTDKTATAQPTAKPSATPTSVAQAATKNELDTLREFCQAADSNTVVAGIVYVENRDGKFAECGITDKQGGGGAMLLSTYINSKWTKMWAGNGIMDAKLCTQYKIPQKIYADCSGNY